jgi:hypothetical protein
MQPHQDPDTTGAILRPERLYIRWKGFNTNMIGALETMASCRQPMADANVRLATNSGAMVSAHQLVLAAASDFLKTLLLETTDEQPIIILDGVPEETIQDLASYLYRGQVNLTPDRLASLILVGKALAIKGIFEMERKLTPPLAHTQPHLTSLCLTPWPVFSQPPPLSASTGLSLLASAALDSGPNPYDSSSQAAGPSVGGNRSAKRRRKSMTNDENDPLNSNSPNSAMNLSVKPVVGMGCPSGQPFSDLTRIQVPRPSAYTQSSFLNIPNPSSLRWKRSLSRSPPATVTSGFFNDPERDETPPLAIDMSATTAASSSTSLPATPSPSPSSTTIVQLSDTVLLPSSRLSLDDSFSSGGEAIALGEGSPIPPLTNPSHSPKDNVRPTSQESQSSQQGKKWKSRQPKLCIHCDRYFSNQFNLKQVLQL